MCELAWQGPRLLHAVGHLGPRGPQSGEKVLVIPGFLAEDRSALELRRALAAAGYRAFPWAMGWNMGATPDLIERLKKRVDEISPDEPILVVGWSLGGVFARELARLHPDRVRAVATLGSPFSGDPHWNTLWKLYEWVAGHPVDDPPIDRIPAKPPVATLAIWSRMDGVIAVASARGNADESDKAVEFDCGHMAFGVSRSVADRVAEELRRFVDEMGV